MFSGGGIYEILNTVNGKRYIGSAVKFQRRWNAHVGRLRSGKHHSPYLQNAWNKYGEAAFKLQIVMLCQPSDLVAWEQRYIDEFKPEYNVCAVAGSTLGIKLTQKTKDKISEAGRGKKYPANSVRMKENTLALGYKHTQETKDKMSEVRRGKERPDTSARMKGNTLRRGVKYPSEFGAAVSVRMTGATHALGSKRTAEENAENSARMCRYHAYKRLMAAQGALA